jgi:hypothetical protein
MARQAGDIKIISTIDDLCFYKMCGEYFVRMKSSLTGKRFWKDKAFEGSRKSCSRFGEGNKIASKVYAMIEKENRVKKLFTFLRRRAILLLKEGVSVEGTEEVLIDWLVEFGFLKKEKEKLISEERFTNNSVFKREELKCVDIYQGLLMVVDSG